DDGTSASSTIATTAAMPGECSPLSKSRSPTTPLSKGSSLTLGTSIRLQTATKLTDDFWAPFKPQGLGTPPLRCHHQRCLFLQSAKHQTSRVSYGVKLSGAATICHSDAKDDLHT